MPAPGPADPATPKRYWLPGLTSGVTALAYAADGGRLFGAGRDGSVLAWPGLGGAPPETWATLPGEPRLLRVERHGATLALATAERVFLTGLPGELDGPSPLRELALAGEPAGRHILAVDFFSDGGPLLVAATREAGPSELHTVEKDGGAGPAPPTLCAGRLVGCTTAKVGRRALLGFAAGRVVLAELGQQLFLDVARQPPDPGAACALSPDGREVALVRGATVERYTPPALSPLEVIAIGQPVRQLRYGSAGQLLLTLATDVVVHPYEWDGPGQLFSHRAPIRAAELRRDGELVVILGEDGRVSAFHGAARSRALRIDEPGRRATAIAVEPRGRSFAIGYDDGAIQVVPLAPAWQTQLPSPPPPPHAHPLFATSIFWTLTGEATTPFVAHLDGVWWVIRINDFPAQPLYSALSSAGDSLDFDTWPRHFWRPE